MAELDKSIGENIRIYRRASHMTLEQLAALIHKSKATVSKYEQGAISVDICTLYEIAAALSLEPTKLLVEIVPRRAPLPHIGAEAASDRRFLYIYNGRSGRILRSLVTSAPTEEGPASVTLFYDVASFDEPGRCRALYYGTKEKHDFVTNYIFENQSNNIEHVSMCLMASLDISSSEFGMLSGISSYSLLPVSCKCTLSKKPLPEDDRLIAQLTLTKEDLRLTKKFNMFTVEQGNN